MKKLYHQTFRISATDIAIRNENLAYIHKRLNKKPSLSEIYRLLSHVFHDDKKYREMTVRKLLKEIRKKA